MRKAFLLVLGLLLTAAASAEEAAPPIPAIIENRTYGFRVSNPDLWQALKNKTGNLVLLGYPAKPKIDFVSVNVEDLSKIKDVTLEEYKKQLLANLQKSIPHFEMRSEDDATIDNTAAHEIIYAGRLEDRAMRWKTVFTLKKNRAYVLTYASDENDYFEHLESAGKILYSFRFL